MLPVYVPTILFIESRHDALKLRLSPAVIKALAPLTDKCICAAAAKSMGPMRVMELTIKATSNMV